MEWLGSRGDGHGYDRLAELGGREVVAMWIDPLTRAPGTDQIRMRMSLTDDPEGTPPVPPLR